MRHAIKTLLLLTLAVGLEISAPAQTVPPLMNYQGRLTAESGTPLPDGTYRLGFRLFPQPEGGTEVWGEEQNVTLVQGAFNVVLGTVNLALSNAFTQPTRYLELTVVRDAANAAVGRTILPRQQLLSTPYALNAGLAANALQAQTLAPSYVNTDLAATVLGAVAQRRLFTADGTWTAPANLASPVIILWGCGGGGGGAGGGGDPITGTGTGKGAGGGGGGGAAPAVRILTVVPGRTYNISIGQGGVGGSGGTRTTGGNSGTDGRATEFDGNLAVFIGGWAGLGGGVGNLNGDPVGGEGGMSNGMGGDGGHGAGGSGGSQQFGRNSPYARGGILGTSSSGSAGLGGGGGAGFGPGGVGGSSPSERAGGAGGAPAPASGAGGGGGGGGAGGFGGGRGGDGGSGFLEILWFAPN
jgi:hypothetical protein